MVNRTDPSAEPRIPLNRERVLRAAIVIADRGGLESLSMRRLGEELGVKAMSLYNHVANKGDVLDGIVDIVSSEIEVPSNETDWKTALRRSAISKHEVLRRHHWASSLWMSRLDPGSRATAIHGLGPGDATASELLDGDDSSRVPCR